MIMKNNRRKYELESLFPDVRLTDSDFAKRGIHDVVTLTDPPITLQTDPVDDVIFAAGPKGFPSSDLSVSRKMLSDPSLLIASQKFQNPINTGSLADSSDTALDSLRYRHESEFNYMERLRSIIKEELKPAENDEN